MSSLCEGAEFTSRIHELIMSPCRFYNAKTGKVNALNGSGRSPKALTLAKARELGIEGFSMKPSNVNSATVAGSAAAWVDIHETWGSGNLTMQELLQVRFKASVKPQTAC